MSQVGRVTAIFAGVGLVAGVLCAPAGAVGATECDPYQGLADVVAQLDTGGQQVCELTFSTVADGSWVVPAGVTSIDVVAVGGGGGGGAGDAVDNVTVAGLAGGGGGGGAVEYARLSVTPAESLIVAVGGAGSGSLDPAGGNGGDGNASTVFRGADPLVDAAGGAGGGSADFSGGTGGAGGDSGNLLAGGAEDSADSGAFPASFGFSAGGGGAGAGAAGVDGVGDYVAGGETYADGGAGGVGVVPTDGLFSGNTVLYGSGGGGGAAAMYYSATIGSTASVTPGVGGDADSSLGVGAGAVFDAAVNDWTSFSSSDVGESGRGAGGGGGADLVTAADGPAGDGADGGSGVVVIRFLLPTKPEPGAPATPVASYTLTYDANGGSCTPTSVTVADGTWVSVPAAADCARSGSLLTGWNTSANGSGLALAPGAATHVTSSNTLFAQWSSSGGSGSTSGSGGGSSGGSGATERLIVTIRFRFAESALTVEAQKALEAKLPEMRAAGSVSVKAVGLAEALAARRAQAISSWLTDHGVTVSTAFGIKARGKWATVSKSLT